MSDSCTPRYLIPGLPKVDILCNQITRKALFFFLLPLIAVLLQTCNVSWQEGFFPTLFQIFWNVIDSGKGGKEKTLPPVFVVYLKGKGYFPFFMPISGLSCIQTMPALLPLLIFCPEHGVISDRLGVLLIKVAILLELTSSWSPDNLVREIGIAGKHWVYPHSSYFYCPSPPFHNILIWPWFDPV